MVDSAPDRAHDMLAYQATITDAYRHYKTEALITYDHRFRIMMSVNPGAVCWDTIESNLWPAAFTSWGRPPVPAAT